MGSIGDRWREMRGKTRFVVCRVLIHLTGTAASPLLGTLNRAGQAAIAADGDLAAVGEGLVEVCQHLRQLDEHWYAAANEGDVVWDEGDASDYFEELFADSAQRYLAQPEAADDGEETLVLSPTENLVVMLTVAAEGEVPQLETDLAEFEALQAALDALVRLHYQDKLQAIQIHFSPARFGDVLTAEQVLSNFPELIPL